MSSSSYFINRDPVKFPSPSEFKPTRWLMEDGVSICSTRYLVSFSKGSRGCIGIKYVTWNLWREPKTRAPSNSIHSLAYFQLYLTLACLVRSFDIELEDDALDPMQIKREALIGLPEKYVFAKFIPTDWSCIGGDIFIAYGVEADRVVTPRMTAERDTESSSNDEVGAL